MAVTFAVLMAVSAAAPFVVVPARAATVSITAGPAAFIPADQNPKWTLDVTDLDGIEVELSHTGTATPKNVALILNGTHTSFNTTVTYSPAVTTDDFTVLLLPDDDVVGTVTLTFRSSTGTFLAQTRTVTIHPDPLVVPTHMATIQEAIDAVYPGRTVAIEPGQYEEKLVVSKDLTLRANDPTKRPALVATAGSGTMFLLNNSAVVTIDGLVVDDQRRSFDGGLWITRGANATVRNLTSKAGRLGVFSGATAAFENLSVTLAGNALRVAGAEAVVENSTFYRVTAGPEVLRGNLTLRNVEVNSSTTTTTANDGNLTLESVVLKVRHSSAGVGIEATDGAYVEATDVTIERADSYKHGVTLERSTMRVDGLRISGGDTGIEGTNSNLTGTGLAVDIPSIGLTLSGTRIELAEVSVESANPFRLFNGRTNLSDTYMRGTGGLYAFGGTVGIRNLTAVDSAIRSDANARVRIVGANVTARGGSSVGAEASRGGQLELIGAAIRNAAVGVLSEDPDSSIRVVASDIDADVGIEVLEAADYTMQSFVGLSDLGDTGVTIRNNASVPVLSPLNYYGPRGPGPERVEGAIVGAEPFLTAPVDIDVDALLGGEDRYADIQTFGYDLGFPAGGRYAFGAAAPLATDLRTTFDAFNGTLYRYDAATGNWTQATGNETLGPMDAVAVVPTSDARAVVDYADSTVPYPTSRRLVEGWNFVGARHHAHAESAFPVGSNGLTELLAPFRQPDGQPGTDADPFLDYTFGAFEPPVVSPFTGYFVYLDAPATIPGKVPVGVRVGDIQAALSGPTGGYRIGSATTAPNGSESVVTPVVLPAAYHGVVTVDGIPAGAGTVVEALVDGEVYATLLTDATGRFGGPGAFAPKLVVGGASLGPDRTVQFRVNGTLVNTTATWEAGTVSALALSTNASAVDPSVTPGDVNGDGAINTGDVIQVQRSIVGLPTGPDYTPLAADVTADGRVNTGDVIQIQRFIVGLSSVLA